VVLMAFAASHLANHALALGSLDLVEAGGDVFRAVWRSPPGTALLYGALAGHIALAVVGLYRRRSLRMPLWQALQIVLGLVIPFWLVVHVIGTRGLNELFGVRDIYHFQFAMIWPEGFGRQSVLILLVWLHGCLGLHFWLRLRPWYQRAGPVLLALALLLPALAIAGFQIGGREVEVRAAADPAWLAQMAEENRWPDAPTLAWVYATERKALAGFLGLLALALAIRGGRMLWTVGRIRVRYPDGTMAVVARGTSVLEASRIAGVPHAAVCGGRGRCSTCRVRVLAGLAGLPPPQPAEVRVLVRIRANDPGIRLACQLRPSHDLDVVPLLPGVATPTDGSVPVNPATGVEREIAVLFADLRAFTRMAEGRLPYDVVFILNQYFKAMGEATELAGGRVDKFIGDGIMALFGVEAPPEEASRQALGAARAMAAGLAALNRQIAQDLPAPLRIGIGVHVGPVILGAMGYNLATSLTAIGDTVNVASRLETLAKEFQAELVVSAQLAARAGVDLAGHPSREIEIRGRRQPLRVYVIADAASLPLVQNEGGPDRCRAAPAMVQRLLQRIPWPSPAGRTPPLR
jgi:adenylate cyclase